MATIFASWIKKFLVYSVCLKLTIKTNFDRSYLFLEINSLKIGTKDIGRDHRLNFQFKNYLSSTWSWERLGRHGLCATDHREGSAALPCVGPTTQSVHHILVWIQQIQGPSWGHRYCIRWLVHEHQKNSDGGPDRSNPVWSSRSRRIAWLTPKNHHNAWVRSSLWWCWLSQEEHHLWGRRREEVALTRGTARSLPRTSVHPVEHDSSSCVG